MYFRSIICTIVVISTLTLSTICAMMMIEASVIEKIQKYRFYIPSDCTIYIEGKPIHSNKCEFDNEMISCQVGLIPNTKYAIIIKRDNQVICEEDIVVPEKDYIITDFYNKLRKKN